MTPHSISSATSHTSRLPFSNSFPLTSAQKIAVFALGCFATWGAFTSLPLYGAAAVSTILWTALAALLRSSSRSRSLPGEPSAPPAPPRDPLISELRAHRRFQGGQCPMASAPAAFSQRQSAAPPSTPRSHLRTRLSELSDSPGSAEKTTEPAPVAFSQRHHQVGSSEPRGSASTLHFGSSPGNSEIGQASVSSSSSVFSQETRPAPLVFSNAHYPVGSSASTPPAGDSLRRRLSFSPGSLLSQESPPSVENTSSAPIAQITAAARQLFSAENLAPLQNASAPLQHETGPTLEPLSPTFPSERSPESASPTPQRQHPPFSQPMPSPIAQFGTALQLISVPSSHQVFSPPTPKRGDTAPSTPNEHSVSANKPKPLSVASSQTHHAVGSSPSTPEFLISPFSSTTQTTSAPVLPSGSLAGSTSLKPVPVARYGALKKGKTHAPVGKQKPLAVAAAAAHHPVGGSSSPADLPPLSPDSIPSPVGTDAPTNSSSSSSESGTLPSNWATVASNLGPPPAPTRSHPPLPPRSVLQALANGASRYPVGLKKGENPA